MTSAQKKRNMLNRTRLCNLKIWIKETLSLSKARGVIRENILLLKYQKQAITAALNGQHNQSNIKNDTVMLLPNALKKSWIYQMLPFILQKWELFRKKKTISLKDFFSSKSKSRLQESLQDEDIDTKFSYQMLSWILCKVT